MDHAQATTIGGLVQPVRVEAPVRAVRVTAVVPCFNRPGDLAALAADLARCELSVGAGLAGPRSRIELAVVVVDNASEPPLAAPQLPGRIATRLVRLATNTGGSGGYNAGMAVALDDEPDYLWLVDSDARVEADTLARLLAAMEADPSVVVAGPTLTDVESGAVHEVGGLLGRKTGRFGPMAAGEGAGPIACDYVAACCAMVRAEAVRRVGLMPDVFLNADDVEWCLRLVGELEIHGSESRATQRRGLPATGEHCGAGFQPARRQESVQARSPHHKFAACRATVVVVPNARAAHPRFDRFGTLPRYFGARNAFGPIDALGLGRFVRFRRAMHEVLRAVNQHLMGRPDLAALHLHGLRDAARGRVRGLPDNLPRAEAMRPVGELAQALAEAGVDGGAAGGLLLDWPADLAKDDRCTVRRALAGAGFDVDTAARAPTRSIAAFLRRAIAGPRHALAVVPAKGSPAHWLVGRVMVELTAGGFVVRRGSRWVLMARCAGAVLAGGWHAVRIGLRARRLSVLPAVEDARRLAPISKSPTAAARACGLSVVVLSYNRRAALLETLARLREGGASRDAEVIVVDNASTDGTVQALADHAPWVRAIALDTNEAIAGFNRGVLAASGGVVLILDDDARPDDAALAGAMELLARRADLAAVTMLPVHPATERSEWPFGEKLARPRDDWPVMGCCNLVRRDVWLAVGGYDGSFFLYRNDVELALKILATGRGVHFNPAWRCEHDSPAAAKKSARWCELATRNWIWLARRHGRGTNRVLGALAGWAWAHRLAGWSPGRQWAVLRGAAAGIVRAPAPLPPSVRPDGRAFAELLRLRR